MCHLRFEPNISANRKHRFVSKAVFSVGRGIRIRTLNDGVRVRSVTVTLYLYVFCKRYYTISLGNYQVKNVKKVIFLIFVKKDCVEKWQIGAIIGVIEIALLQIVWKGILLYKCLSALLPTTNRIS